MFILDDILLQHIGITVPGLNLFWTFEQIRDFAYREMYNPEEIKNEIKKNRLLFEFGEVTREEYEKINSELLQKLKLAEHAEEMDLRVRTDILGVR